MPISIQAIDHDAPVPRQVSLTLICDNHPENPATFTHMGGYMEERTLAMLAGWKIVPGSDRQMVYCPMCSGKKPGKARQDSLFE